MTFGQPLWFWAFALFPVLVLLFLQNERSRRAQLGRLVAARLLDRLAGTVSTAKRRLRFALALLGLAAVIVSLAQPRYGFSWQERKLRGRDVLIAIDTSKSMLATDLAPSRLARAKLAAQDLIDGLGGDRVGLIAFAGSAFLQAPLTADTSAVLSSLQELDTEIIPRGGTDLAGAIRTAAEAFGKGEGDHRALVIFTDGEELDADGVQEAARQKDAMRIYTVGVGSPDGSLIPMPGSRGGNEFLKDPSGQIIKSRLDEERLRKIAESAGGFYLRLSNGRDQISQLIRDGLETMTEEDVDAKTSRQPIERYQWPLSLGLVLLAASALVGERRARRPAASGGVPAGRAARAASVIAGLALGLASAAQASNAGVEAFERKDFKAARDAFAEEAKKAPGKLPLQFNLGRAAYQMGEYDQALEAFGKAVISQDPDLRARAEFNLGNTLLRRSATQKETAPKIQELENALQHYQQALKINPQNAEAEANRQLTARLIEELKKAKPPEDQKDDQKKDQKQDQKQDQKDQKDQKDQQNGQQNDGKQDTPQQDGQKKDGQKQDGSQQQDGKDGKDGEPGGQKDQKDSAGQEKKQDGADKQQGQKDSGGGDPGAETQKAAPKDGALGERPQFGPGSKEAQEAAESAAEAAAAAEGRMTEHQAKNLLDSLKGEDARVQLADPGERKLRGRVVRDW